MRAEPETILREKEEPRIARLADWASAWLIYGMLLFSPWAFGTTREWSIRPMNRAGFVLGALLLIKWIARLAGRKARRAHASQPLDARGSKWFGRSLAALTVLILTYCWVAAWNAQATYSYFELRFFYHDYISWLPHSYDSDGSWIIFWNYLALACSFWAVRDWIQNDPPVEGERNPLFSRRWKKLLWVISINGAVLGLEGLVQRADNTGKLLWLVEPRIHKTADAQFGPYAYRSNGAQFLNLIWPTAVGFWCALQQSVARARRRRTAHHLLLPGAMIMAAGSIISLSRGGVLIAGGGIVLSLIILWTTNWRSSWKIKSATFAICAMTLALAAFVNWADLKTRFSTVATDQLSGRLRLYRMAAQMARDHPIFGTGPNTFEPVSQIYLESPDDPWTVQAHNDWLETLATFGWVGSSLIWLALLLVLVRPLLAFQGLRVGSVLIIFIWLALAGCLVHGIFDFPFQIYSILFLFLVLCAVLSSMSLRPPTGSNAV